MPQDTSQAALEQTFSDLANARLRDKSPVLLDYLVGFQLIESEDDGSRAVGMFAFEIGGDWHYSSVFFLNGEVRGLDSIYSVKSDLFVPLNEDWVNSIINRRPTVLGEPDKRDRRQRGVRSPDLNRLRTLPSGADGMSMKRASLADAPPLPIHRIMQMRKAAAAVDLPSGVAALGPKVASALISALHDTSDPRNVKLANAIRRFYDPLDFTVPAEVKVAAEAEGDPITIISYVGQEGSDDLTDAQRQQIIEGDIAVVDKRPEMQKSVVYSTETKQQLQNPTCGGLYDVLMSTGKIAQCVIVPLYGEDGLVAVIERDTKKFGITAPAVIFTTRQYTETDFKEAWEAVTSSADDVRVYDCVSWICHDGGGATTPVKVTAVNRDGELTVVKTDGYSCCGRYSSVPSPHGFPGAPSPASYENSVEEVVLADGGRQHATTTKGRQFVNTKSYRAFVVENDAPSQDYTYDPADRFDRFVYSDFGDHNTIVEAMEKVASPLRVWTTDSEIVIADADGAKSFGKAAAVGYLLRKHGCSEADARTMLKLASRRPQRWMVKRAASADLMSWPDLNDTDDSGPLSAFHRSQRPFEATQGRDGGDRDNASFYEYVSPFGGGDEGDGESAFGAIERAAETGQKEVFDAAVLGSLVKSKAPTEMVERFLPTIVAGMDRLGRILFLVYWHYDEFQERYGKEDLADFVDNLRSTFEAIGDLVIFMRKRTLSGDPEFYGLGLNATMDG
jgi:hypothetical protein